jgi:hypothetical protein
VIPRRAVEQLVEQTLAGFDARRASDVLSGVDDDTEYRRRRPSALLRPTESPPFT